MTEAEWLGNGEPMNLADCTLGQRIGSEDFDYVDPRCECGCRLWWIAVTGWVCTHCDDGDYLPPCQVTG
jgi:hypothetical protein